VIPIAAADAGKVTTSGGVAHVAGTVRARALGRRRTGPALARRIAACPDLDAAVEILLHTPYGHDVRPGQSLERTQDGVAATLLWHLRILAGWLPLGGAEPLRAAAAWFEIHNVERLARRLRGLPAEPAYRLGALATSWPRLARAATTDALHAELAACGWIPPGTGSRRAVALGMRIAWARRIAAIPPARTWAAGAVALLVARERWLADGFAGPATASLIGRAEHVASFPAFVAALAPPARWALEGIEQPTDLWRGESRWWRRVERDGECLLRNARFDDRVALGAAVVLAVDAWRVRAALACAADGGDVTAFEAVIAA
jgi:hypothetical protein